MGVGLEMGQPLVQRSVAGASIIRARVVDGQLPQVSQLGSERRVLVDQDVYASFQRRGLLQTRPRSTASPDDRNIGSRYSGRCPRDVVRRQGGSEVIALEVVGSVVLLFLVVAATWMAVVGLLGAVGAVRLRRCRACGHLITSGTPRSRSICPYCRHPWLGNHLMPLHLQHFLPGEMTPADVPARRAPRTTLH